MNFMERFSGIAVIAILLFLCLVLFSGCTEDAAPSVDYSEEERAAEALQSLKSDVSASLSETFSLAEKTSKELTEIDRNETQVNAILDNSQKSLPWVESVAFISPGGQVVAIIPELYGDLVGVDLSYQEIVQEALANRSPVMSDYLLLAQGEKGVVLEYPVFSEDDEFVGIASLVIDPAKLIEPFAEEIRSEYGYSVMAILPDGLILYDEDPGEIGNETFGNPLYEVYPGVIAAAEAASSQPLGSYNYTFMADGFDYKVHKQAYWDTAGILDKEWRLMVIREISVFIS